MTPAIFYDLETSDLNFIGQILNFSFILVDAKWNVQDEFSSEVKINRLQLPRAKAIAANRIDVLKHQQQARFTESEAMGKIAEFLQSFADQSGVGVGQFIGYNSANFDLPYLRTSLIRNGFNPYFKAQNRDLFLLTQKLWLTNQDFRERLTSFANQKQISVNLKLETLCQAHNLLDGKQLHESRDDVLLTIELAKTFLQLYNHDIRTFEPYQARACHEAPRNSVFLITTGISKLEPVKRHHTLLTADHKSALWVDLEHFAECQEKGKDPKESVRWIKFESKIFLPEKDPINDLKYLELAKNAVEEFKDLRINNFFEETTCDIEQFIYRIPFKSYPELYKFMRDPKGSAKLGIEEKELVKRYRLANYQIGEGDDKQMKDALAQYAEYRYQGKAKLAKNTKYEFNDPEHRADFHPTVDELLAEIETVRKEDPESLEIMNSLEQFYLESDIYQILKTND